MGGLRSGLRHQPDSPLFSNSCFPLSYHRGALWGDHMTPTVLQPGLSSSGKDPERVLCHDCVSVWDRHSRLELEDPDKPSLGQLLSPEETRKAEAGFSVMSARGYVAYVGDRLFARGMDGMKPLPLRVPLASCLS